MEGSIEDENEVWSVRARQERSVAINHTLSAMEYALAHEAAAVGRVFAHAGVSFDTRTFIGLRLLEASIVEAVEPLEVLRLLDERGALERSAAIADGLLEGDAAGV
jgi:hypothetical protein